MSPCTRMNPRMTSRAERVGTKRPRKPYEAPLPRDWWGVLEELPNELGLEVALIVRRLWLAAESAPGRRESLFRPGATVSFVAERRDEAVKQMAADARHELRALLSVNGTGMLPPAELATAAEALGEWAQASGLVHTALNLAEAGAAIAPDDAHACFVAARTNRQIGEPWRAEVFYRRAILLAYREQNWKDYIRAQLGLGTLLLDRGHLVAAAKRYKRAARVADDQGIEWLAAQTFHDLAALHLQQGDTGAAVDSLLKALEVYPKSNERFPIAVHDLAFLHAVTDHHADALPLLRLLLPIPLHPQDQVLIGGTLARVAGALGFRSMYAEGEGRVLQFSETHRQHADAAFVNVAHGARSLGLWGVAAEHAGRAARIASEAGHPGIERDAWALITEIAAKKPGPPPAPPLSGERAAELRRLAENLDADLRGWRWLDQSGPSKLGPRQC